MRELASLLSVGLEDVVGALPTEMRRDVWGLLESLMVDPEPDAHPVASVGPQARQDFFTESINTPRGEGLHAVVRYALWVRRIAIADLPKGGSAATGFTAMPEVREMLQQHLDPDVDASPAIRAVYGRWIPWLALLDEEWVRANLVLLFPARAKLAILRDAVWDTYVVWCDL